ncbi:MAG: tetratricopeptide repeat protein [Acidobacteria bacterium]|nr:tetratricopeptide repeat protein [Acidobacteriota bacterium]
MPPDQSRPSVSPAVLAGFFALLLNSAYLAAFAHASVFYFMNVGVHPLVGLGLGVILARRFAWRGLRASSSLLTAGVLGLALGLILGVAVLVFGATRPYRALLQAHILASTAGAALVTIHLWRAVSQGRAAALLVRLAVSAAIIAAGAALVLRLGRSEDRRQAYRIENPTVVPSSMDQEGSGPTSPFFPSSADTNVRGIIPANFFLTSENCGRCHRDVYEQWSSSAHHFSSFNNQWYRKSVEYMQDVVGTRPSKWCAGCHDHAVFFNGRFERPIKEQIETPEAHAGLACTSCHSITRVRSTMGQGDFEIEYPPLHDLAVSHNPVLRAVHDKLLELDPEPHRETFLKPFHREQTPEFCSTCHKVHLDVPVNAYRWFRGFNDYDNWQASGVSGEGARSFYYPPKSQKCADCHMPLVDSNDPAARNGRIRSHRFPAANAALPFVNGDSAQLTAVQAFLKDGQVSVDIFGIVRAGAPAAGAEIGGREGAETQIASTFAVGEESMAFGAERALMTAPAEVVGPLGKVPVSVHRGESVRLEVVVRTRKVGHFFPAGTVDAFDVWVELEAVDDRGRKVFHSGALENGSGPVDPGAHFYRSLLLDEHGNRINKRNAWAARSVAYVRLIPPGAADTIHYRLDIPSDAGDRIFLTAKVNYRKFAWWNTQWAFAGVRDPGQPRFPLAPGYDDGRWVFVGDTSRVSGRLKAVPDVPITVMAENRASLTVLPEDAARREAQRLLDPSVRERWNDYGIGLLLQGDIKGAESVFLEVTRMEPGYADGWVNVGRARIQEGNMAGAEQVLRAALDVDPQLAKSHFFLATALKALGRYDEAVAHLRHASSQYPRDRVVLNQLGRVLFLKRRYDEAIVQFQRVLTIDPEDLQAHYNLMLCYQGLGDSANGDKERVLYLRFKADESSQAITGNFRRLNPEDNNERQQIHEHRSGPLLPSLYP